MKNVWLASVLFVGCGDVQSPPADGPVSSADPDGDGLTTADELAGWDIQVLALGTSVRTMRHVTSDPMKADTDGDGRTDAQEKAKATDPTLADTDLDGLTDAEEEVAQTDPTNFDSDGNRVLDVTEHKGLIALYRLDSIVNNRLLDASGNGHDALPAGNIAGFMAFNDRFNRSARALYHAANGVNTSVNGWATADVGPIDPQHWTLSVWINGHPVTGQAFGQPANFGFSTDVKTAGIQVASVTFGDNNRVGDSNNTALQYPEDQWHHWVTTRNGNAVDLYKNGALVFSGTTTFTPAVSCRILMLWGWATTCVDTTGPFNAMDAALDDLRVWDRSLTADEIAGLTAETPSM